MPPRQMPLVAVREKEPVAKSKRPKKYASKLSGGTLKHPNPPETASLSLPPPQTGAPPADSPAISSPQPEPLSDPAQLTVTPPSSPPAASNPPPQPTPIQSSFLSTPSAEAASPAPSDTPQSSVLSPQPSKDDYHHNSEVEFARLLDYYGIEWQYEPRQFPLQWRDGRPVEMFTPDFYLPEFDLYIELTTMRQALVRRKNRKLRLLRALYPEINIKLLYRRDYQRLLERFGIRPDTPTIGADGAVYTSPPAEDGRLTIDDGSIVVNDHDNKTDTEE